jgi:acetyl/propionyl-CoA carboxylase alpha subunit
MGFRLNAASRNVWVFTIDGRKFVSEALSAQANNDTWLVGPASDRRPVRHQYIDEKSGALYVDDRSFSYARVAGDVVLFDRGDSLKIAKPHYGAGASGPASDGSLRAPMPGKIVATPAKPGDTVTRGQPVVVLEAMKMEHALVAPFDGVVGEIGVSVGDQVAADTVLAVVMAAEQ